MTALSNKVKKAICQVFMAEGIEGQDQIKLTTLQALQSIGYMSIPAYKAHKTMRRNRK